MAHPASSSIEEMAANSSHIISDGAHLTDEIALTLVECREILEEATAKEEQAQTQEQINALKAMITDMDQKPEKSRIREMAKLLNVPQKNKDKNMKMDDLYRAVQKSFLKNVAAIKKDRKCHRGQAEQRAEQLMADVRAFGRWPLQHAKSEDPERERERLLAQRVAKMRAAACLPPAAVEELKALASQHRGAQRTADPYFCSIAEQVAAGSPACMEYEWMVLMQRLDFMSSSPIPKDILAEFARPKLKLPHRKATSWWARAGIVEHPKIPVGCPQGGKQGTISNELMHYNLTHVLLEDAKMFLAAVAEYNRVVHEEDSEAAAEYAARELLPKGYFWDGWDKLHEQYTQAVSSSGDQHPAVIGPVKSIPPELLSSRGLHPVAETETSSASSQCKCPHDLDAADMKKLWCEIEFHSYENLDELMAILTHRLWCMSQLGPHMQPTVSAKLQAYAQPQIEWWKRAANSQCERMQNGNILYNLRCVLYADVQAYLAAVAECDRIQDAANKKFLGFTEAECRCEYDTWTEATRKEKEFGTPEYWRERTRAYSVMEQMLKEAQLLPISASSVIAILDEWGTPTPEWKRASHSLGRFTSSGECLVCRCANVHLAGCCG